MGGGAYHEPVLCEAVVALLLDTPEGPLVDATAGGGGHLAALVEASAGRRRVVGVDRDPEAVAAVRARLALPVGDVRHGDFRELRAVLASAGLSGPAEVAGILVDLGVSSWQLDQAARGFGLKHAAAPLDMRMDPSSGSPTARELIDRLDERELARILASFGEVPNALRVARAIKAAADGGRLDTTADLARAVEAVQKTARRVKVHPATTVAQALRIAVNGELAALDRLLAEAADLLRPGGRLAVISYHSLEDRRVKTAFREGQDGPPRPRQLPPPSGWRPSWRVVTRQAIKASPEEVARNPRSRSARLRAAERPTRPSAGVRP